MKKLLQTFLLLIWLAPGMSYAAAGEISYSGRLTAADGKPVAGPVELEIRFFSVATGGTAYATRTIPNVQLSQGVFQVTITMSHVEQDAMFAGADTYIEVRDKTSARTYPRQKFYTVPLAMRVPVDGDTLAWNSSGELEIKASASIPAASMVLTSNGSGAPSVSVTGPAAGGDYTFVLPPNTGSSTDVLTLMPDGSTAWQPAGTPGAHAAAHLDGGVDPIADMTPTANMVPQADGTGKIAAGWLPFDGHSLDASDGSPSDALVVDADGKVGIGTAAPDQKLVVDGSIKSTLGAASGSLSIHGKADLSVNGSLAYMNTFGTYLWLEKEDGSIGSIVRSYGDSYFNGGNVGIGTAAPGAKLEVNGQIKVTGGAPGAGKVLTTVDGTGLATWESVPAGNFSGIATGTNVSATMTVGAGATIAAGGGIIESTVFKGSGSSSNAVDLATAEVSGTLPVANGGTGVTTGAANRVFATPDGAAGAPTLRALTADDIPSLTSAKISDFATADTSAQSKCADGTFLRGEDGAAVCRSAAQIVSDGAGLKSGDSAGGDLTGSYPNPTLDNDSVGSAEIADGSVALADLSPTICAANEILKMNGAGMALTCAADDLGPGDGHSLDAADGLPADVVYVDNAGNVGIGTTSPTASSKVHVTGMGRFEDTDASDTQRSSVVVQRTRSDATTPGANFGGLLGFMLEGFTNGSVTYSGTIGSAWEAAQTNNTTARDSYMAFSTVVDNTVTERLRITSDGDVGIGTTNPTGHVGTRRALILSDTTNDALFEVWGANGGKSLFQSVLGSTYLGSLAKGTGVGSVHISYGDGVTGMSMMGDTGYVGIGTQTPSGRLHIASDNSTWSYVDSHTDGGGGSAAIVALRRSRGTAAAKTAVIDGNFLSQTISYGYDGSNFIPAGGVVAIVDGTPGTNDMPGRLAFYTTPDGASGTIERMRIDNAGNVGIGETSPDAKLQVAGQIVSNQNTVASGATVDFNTGNVQVLESVGTDAIVLNNMQDGGAYTLIVSDTTSRTYTFTNCTNSYFQPTNAATTNGKRTVYTILKTTESAQTRCYISWITGF